MNYDFTITKHARERFVERFSSERHRFVHLSGCKQTACNVCRNLTYDLYETVRQNKRKWDSVICAKLHDAEEIRVFYNNSEFMARMYERYGYERFNFLCESDIIFVTKNGNIVLTCMDICNPVNNSMILANFVRRQKFKKHEQTLC
jgi:hypothetical protein